MHHGHASVARQHDTDRYHKDTQFGVYVEPIHDLEGHQFHHDDLFLHH